MAELDERLKQLLSDENSMKQFMEVASALLGRSEVKSPAEGTDTSARQASTTSNSPPMSDMLSALLAQIGSSAGQGAPAAGAGAAAPTASVLPQLLQTISDKNVQINEQRLNLVKAMKPYLAENRATSIDRAVKMANVAKAAKNALGLLGR